MGGQGGAGLPAGEAEVVAHPGQHAEGHVHEGRRHGQLGKHLLLHQGAADRRPQHGEDVEGRPEREVGACPRSGGGQRLGTAVTRDPV